MTRNSRSARLQRTAAALAVAGALLTVAAAPAGALEILYAADHAELTAEVSGADVNRIALEDDRIARVVQAPGGFRTEHDPVSGDLWLLPSDVGPDGGSGDRSDGLFIGTEKGFTYRLTLRVADRAPAQILIRNPAIKANNGEVDQADSRVGHLVDLVRAMAMREPLAGYRINAAHANPDPVPGDMTVLEIWQGRSFTGRLLSLRPELDADAVRARLSRLAALWMAPADADGGRLAVAVERAAGTETGDAGAVQ